MQELTGRARAEAERLRARKRRAYQVALAGGVVIVLLSWAARPPDDAFLALVYPAFAAILVIFLGVLLRWPRALVVVEPVMLATVVALVLARLAWHFHAADSIDDQLLVLVGGHYWAVGLVIVAAFVVLDHRWGLRAGAAILLAAVVIAATGVVLQEGAGGVSESTLVYLIRVHVFLVVLLALASLATSMRDTVKEALLRSEVMEQAARTDPLTHLENRRGAESVLRRHMALAERYGSSVAVISMDIDHFKMVNDTWGHSKGDEVIAGVARILARSVREPDLVARWGGEEFLILAPEITLEEARQLTERCRKAIANEPIGGIRITGSFGVTVFRTGESLDALLGRADALLYRAKEAGRDRTEAG